MISNRFGDVKGASPRTCHPREDGGLCGISTNLIPPEQAFLRLFRSTGVFPARLSSSGAWGPSRPPLITSTIAGTAPAAGKPAARQGQPPLAEDRSGRAARPAGGSASGAATRPHLPLPNKLALPTRIEALGLASKS